MMEMECQVYLEPADNATILTTYGKISGLWTHNENDPYDFADAIQEIMCQVMKEPEHHEGMWFWTITSHWEAVYGIEVKYWE